jgi:hypothetical protein
MTMTDQNQYPSDRNDPNRPGGSSAQNPAGAAGNASGGQYPTGQPGEYAERGSSTPDGQFGQPGEYAGGPRADDHVGHPSPQQYPGPDDQGQPGQGQYGTGSYGTGSSGTGSSGTDPYAAPHAPVGPNATGAIPPGQGQQYGTGQYGAGQYGTGQYGTDQNATGAYAPVQQGSSPFDQSAFTEQPRRQPRQRTDENGEPYGVGPFSLREAIIAGLAILLLIASFLPLLGGEYAEFIGYSNLWGPAPWLVIPGALLFVAAAALLVLRRVVPKPRWRVGSLSVDQFASAAAIVTAGFHAGAILLMLGLGVWFGGLNDGFAPGAGPILGLIVSLAAVALTTFATLIPPFAADFRDRPESSAHPYARAAKPVPQRPKPAPEAQNTWTGPDSASGAAPAAAAATAYADPNAGWQQPAAADPWPGAVTPSAPADAAAAVPAGDGFAGTQSAPATAAYAYRDDRQDATSGEPTWSAPEANHGGTPLADATSPAEPTSEAQAPVVAFGDEPRVEATAPIEDVGSTSGDVSAVGTVGTSPAEPVESAVSAPAAFAPYWVLAPEQRPVVDLTTGVPVFEVGPTAWSLAVGERDGGLVIRADDGRVGLLRATDGLTRG